MAIAWLVVAAAAILLVPVAVTRYDVPGAERTIHIISIILFVPLSSLGTTALLALGHRRVPPLAWLVTAAAWLPIAICVVEGLVAFRRIRRRDGRGFWATTVQTYGGRGDPANEGLRRVEFSAVLGIAALAALVAICCH